MKTFYLEYGIGECKYVVNYHDGEKTHEDGSLFFDIAIFKNKTKANRFVRGLILTGYKPTYAIKF